MEHRSQKQMETWLRAVCADADHRGLPALKPLLEALAQSTVALREADRTAREAAAAAAGAGQATVTAGGTETTE